jgi:hypothetical protein
VSQDRSRRRRPKPKAAQSGKNANRGQGKAGGRKKQQGRKPAVDPRRPFWANDVKEAEVWALIGVVRPAQDPTALVRSLGSPPLGKFATSAQHYYAPVYEKAQQFAIAMATANGVLLSDGDEDGEDDRGDDAGSDPADDR